MKNKKTMPIISVVVIGMLAAACGGLNQMGDAFSFRHDLIDQCEYRTEVAEKAEVAVKEAMK